MINKERRLNKDSLRLYKIVEGTFRGKEWSSREGRFRD